jgi:hypothetical protein
MPFEKNVKVDAAFWLSLDAIDLRQSILLASNVMPLIAMRERTSRDFRVGP